MPKITQSIQVNRGEDVSNQRQWLHFLGHPVHSCLAQRGTWYSNAYKSCISWPAAIYTLR